MTKVHLHFYGIKPSKYKTNKSSFRKGKQILDLATPVSSLL